MTTTTGVFVRATACGILAALCGVAVAQTTQPTAKPTVEQWQRDREQKIMRAVGVDKWPKSERLTLAPVIDRSWLSNPDLVTKETTSIGMADIKGWGTRDIRWSHRPDPPEPEPTELTPEHQEWFDQWMEKENVPDAERKKRHERELEDYRRAKRLLASSLRVRMFLAGSAREAQEQLVRGNSVGNAPDELYIGRFHDELRVANLGDIAFKWSTPRGVPYAKVMMVRGNVGVTIEGHGLFVGDVEKLAAKIDAAILKEPAVTDWNTARPSASLARQRELRRASRVSGLTVTHIFWKTVASFLEKE